jgi:transcriptional regulator of heat shock response
VQNILDMPEFYDYELTHRLFETLDHFDFWWTILEAQDDQFDIVLGDAMGSRGMLSQCGFVYVKFSTPHVAGAIGVVGPSRLNYVQVVPLVRYVGGLIGEFASSW